MSYRMKDWKKLEEHPCSGDGCLQCRDYANREAEADAMLEGLKKLPGTKRILPEWEYSDKDGYLVFIPDEE